MFSRGFLGVLPTKLVATIGRVCRPEEWPAVYVACSGTFRIERGLRALHEGIRLHSNDVSLFSTAVGRAALNDPLPFRFKGELAFIEELGLEAPRDRISAILVALNYAGFVRGKVVNRFKQAHAAHMRSSFRAYVADTRKRVDRVMDEIRIERYFGGDFRDHIEAAIEAKAGVLAFPPTFRGGYEKMFQFVHDNVEWDPPPYRLYDPEKETGDVLERLNASGIPFFFYTDHPVEGHKPQVMLEQKGKRPVFGYARAAGASYNRSVTKGKPFAYKAVDLAKLHKKTRLSIAPVPESHATFLRETYLKKTIAFGQGDYSVLVYLDDMLAGLISYRKPMTSASDVLYVLTDLATTREGRIAKLIARVATCREVVAPLERRLIRRFRKVRTTAFSDHPEAMKYRGSWAVETRKEVNALHGRYAINYLSDLRLEPAQSCFAWWWQRDGQREVAAARNRNPAG